MCCSFLPSVASGQLLLQDLKHHFLKGTFPDRTKLNTPITCPCSTTHHSTLAFLTIRFIFICIILSLLSASPLEYHIHKGRDQGIKSNFRALYKQAGYTLRHAIGPHILATQKGDVQAALSPLPALGRGGGLSRQPPAFSILLVGRRLFYPQNPRRHISTSQSLKAPLPSCILRQGQGGGLELLELNTNLPLHPV